MNLAAAAIRTTATQPSATLTASRPGASLGRAGAAASDEGPKPRSTGPDGAADAAAGAGAGADDAAGAAAPGLSGDGKFPSPSETTNCVEPIVTTEPGGSGVSS